jgi:hypothetical protein
MFSRKVFPKLESIQGRLLAYDRTTCETFSLYNLLIQFHCRNYVFLQYLCFSVRPLANYYFYFYCVFCSAKYNFHLNSFVCTGVYSILQKQKKFLFSFSSNHCTYMLNFKVHFSQKSTVSNILYTVAFYDTKYLLLRRKPYLHWFMNLQKKTIIWVWKKSLKMFILFDNNLFLYERLLKIVTKDLKLQVLIPNLFCAITGLFTSKFILDLYIFFLCSLNFTGTGSNICQNHRRLHF